MIPKCSRMATSLEHQCSCLLLALAVVAFTVTVVIEHSSATDPYSWYPRDNFDYIMEKMKRANPENCPYLSEADINLPATSVGQMPKYNRIPLQVWFANRSKLMQLHTVALNRAYFFSYIMQRLNDTETAPNLLPSHIYYYFAGAADVSSGPQAVNASGIFFDTNCSYANWYIVESVNTTFPLFAPIARRLDNWNDETNLLRVPTNRTIELTDMGTGPFSNYTAPWYKNNPYIHDKEMGISYIPDTKGTAVGKNQYSTRTQLADVNGNLLEHLEVVNFFGPNAPGIKETFLPVRFTRPYYDCGHSNRWIVSSVSALSDYMPRYSPYNRLRGPRMTGVVVASMDFLRIDFNPCPASPGNPESFLSGVARCKPTTMCVPISGYGFARGGYVCVCQPGFRLPMEQNGPFRGIDIEQATQLEYQNGFDCLPIGWREVVPTEIAQNLDAPTVRRVVRSTLADVAMAGTNALAPVAKFIGDYFTGKKRTKRELNIPFYHVGDGFTFTQSGFDEVNRLLAHVKTITPDNCATKPPEQLKMPGGVSYGAEVQFEVEGRVALRLAHFLSAYYQNNIVGELYGNLKSGAPLNRFELFGEVYANVLSNFEIVSSGVFFDRHTFRDHDGVLWDLFAPFAYKPVAATQVAEAIDMSIKSHRNYTSESWFRLLKERWVSSRFGLELITTKPYIRSDINGTQIQRYFNFPLFYRVPRYEEGHWTEPYYLCGDGYNGWVITYAAPFFGFLDDRQTLNFMGVVTISVSLHRLDIQQCPQSFYTPNFFKSTALCDFRNTYCENIPGRRLRSGAYKCMCRQGFEYPFNDLAWFFDGETMEREYSLKMAGQISRYDILKCRQGVASSLSYSVVHFAVIFAVSFHREFA